MAPESQQRVRLHRYVAIADVAEMMTGRARGTLHG
jgi:hypothetical protein